MSANAPKEMGGSSSKIQITPSTEAPAGSGKIAGVVAFYFIISISLVFVNKTILSSKELSIPAPLTVTWFQCVVSAVICYAVGELGRTAPKGTYLHQFPVLRVDHKTLMSVAKLSFFFVGMITFNNLCLKYVEVSFYQVARSLTIGFNVLFTWILLGEQTTMQVLGCLVIVVLGFYLGTESEVNFSLIGVLFGVASSAFVSLNSIFIKEALGFVKAAKVVEAGRDKMWLLSGVNNVIASVLFLPLILVSGEVDVILEHSHLLTNAGFWGSMLLSGVLGFLIGIATVMQIQATSPLTHNVSGTAKAAVQTVLGLLYFGNETNVTNMAGVALVLGGSLLYAYVRQQEKAKATAEQGAGRGGGKGEAVEGGSKADPALAPAAALSAEMAPQRDASGDGKL